LPRLRSHQEPACWRSNRLARAALDCQRFEAAILSRTRSPITSRSNWANESRHIQREPAHTGRSVERLGDRNEGDLMLVEQFDQPGKVGERSGEPVDFVHHHDVDLSALDVITPALRAGSSPPTNRA